MEDSTLKAYWCVRRLVALEQGEVLDASRDPLTFVLGGRHMEILSTKVEHNGLEVISLKKVQVVLEIEIDSGLVLHLFIPTFSNY